MDTIASNPIFQILTTTILTLLGTAGLTYYFYKKQKRDHDKPEVTYWISNLNGKHTIIIETLFKKQIHNITLTTIKPKRKPGGRSWKVSIKKMASYNNAIQLEIPEPECNMISFTVKIQYQYIEHKYTDKLTLYPQESKYILH